MGVCGNITALKIEFISGVPIADFVFDVIGVCSLNLRVFVAVACGLYGLVRAVISFVAGAANHLTSPQPSNLKSVV